MLLSGNSDGHAAAGVRAPFCSNISYLRLRTKGILMFCNSSCASFASLYVGSWGLVLPGTGVPQGEVSQVGSVKWTGSSGHPPFLVCPFHNWSSGSHWIRASPSSGMAKQHAWSEYFGAGMDRWCRNFNCKLNLSIYQESHRLPLWGWGPGPTQLVHGKYLKLH